MKNWTRLVTHVMPAILSSVKDGNSALPLARAVMGVEEVEGQNVEDYGPALYLFEMLLLESALVHNGCETPAILQDEITQQSEKQGRVPVLLYGDLIFTRQPEGENRRSFFGGWIGVQERRFYDIHGLMEADLFRYWATWFSYRARGEDVPNGFRRRMSTAIGVAIRRFKLFYEDPKMKEAFDIFRRYFLSHPVLGTPGPSGRYSAAFPVMDLLIHGSALPQKRRDGVRASLPFLPPTYQALCVRQLLELADEEKLAPMDDVEEIQTKLRAFRAAHFKLVKDFVPEAFAGAVGTGGATDVPTFLREHIQIGRAS